MPDGSWILWIVVFGGLLPAFAGVALLWPTRFRPKFDPSHWTGVALAVVVAGCGEFLEATDYGRTSPIRPLLLLVFAGGVLGLLEWRLPTKVRIFVQMGFSGIATRMLIPGFIANQFDGLESIPSNLGEFGRIVGLFVALFGTWHLLSRVTERQRGPTLPFVLSAIALTTAFAIEFTGYTRLTLLTIIPASFLGGCGLASWRSPDRDWVQGMLPGIVSLVVGGAFTGWFHNGGGATNLCLAPSIIGLILIGLVGPGRIRTQRMVAGACVLTSIAIMAATS